MRVMTLQRSWSSAMSAKRNKAQDHPRHMRIAVPSLPIDVSKNSRESIPSLSANAGSEQSPQKATVDVAERMPRSYARAVSVMRSQLNSLRIAGCESDVCRAYQSILDYLSSLDVERVREILEHPSPKDKSFLELSDEQLASLSLDQAISLINVPGATRKFLERLAAHRFFVTPGDLSGTRNREALIEKLHALAGNERTLQTIERLAGEGQPKG